MKGASDPPGRSEPSDAELIAAVASRDRAAFDRLFDRYAARIRAFLVRTGASEPDADEIAQDVMLSIWRGAASFDPGRAAPATWIFAIARHRHVDMLRRRRQRVLDQGDPTLQPGFEPDGAARITLTERDSMLRQSLNSLPPGQRDVLRMAFFEDLSHGEIAERAGLPLGTVKSRIRLAVRHLRRTLGDTAALETPGQ